MWKSSQSEPSAQMRGKDAGCESVGRALDDDGARAVTEEDAGSAILPVVKVLSTSAPTTSAVLTWPERMY